MPENPAEAAPRWTPADLCLGLAPLVAWRLWERTAPLHDPSPGLRLLRTALALVALVWMGCWPWLRRRGGPDGRTLWAAGRADARREWRIGALYGVLAFLMVIYVLWAAKNLLGQQPDPPVFWEGLDGPVWSVALAVVLLLGVTAAPLAEEGFFRGLAFEALSPRLGQLAASVLQAALFAFLHPWGRTRSVLYLALALLLAFVRQSRGTLASSVLAHATFNALMSAVVLHEALWPGPYLGVAGEGTAEGVRVLGVAPDSPAERAGLVPGDVIEAFDGAPLASVGDLRRAIKERRPGDTIEVRVLRGGETLLLPIELATPPPPW